MNFFKWLYDIIRPNKTKISSIYLELVRLRTAQLVEVETFYSNIDEAYMGISKVVNTLRAKDLLPIDYSTRKRMYLQSYFKRGGYYVDENTVERFISACDALNQEIKKLDHKVVLDKRNRERSMIVSEEINTIRKAMDGLT